MSGTLPWYVARSTGLVAWVLLTASVVWGLTLSTKALGRRPRPAWVLDLHRYLGGLATVFTAVHIAAILSDTYVHFGLTSVLVPFATTWHPAAVAWGIAGLYLLVAVEVTSLVRNRLPRRVWRAIHFASFPLFGVASVHALTAGTDAGSRFFEMALVSAVVMVTALSAIRISQSSVGGASAQRELRGLGWRRAA